MLLLLATETLAPIELVVMADARDGEEDTEAADEEEAMTAAADSAESTTIDSTRAPPPPLAVTPLRRFMSVIWWWYGSGTMSITSLRIRDSSGSHSLEPCCCGGCVGVTAAVDVVNDPES